MLLLRHTNTYGDIILSEYLQNFSQDLKFACAGFLIGTMLIIKPDSMRYHRLVFEYIVYSRLWHE